MNASHPNPLAPSVDQTQSVSDAKPRRSAFDALGFRKTVAHLQDEIRVLYAADNVPWIIGYSGGKDSTTTLQLIWTAIAALPPDSRRKTVHVISTDTLVENPIVSAWVGNSIEIMGKAADEQGMPFEHRLLRPKLRDRFWVNLIGRGYPALVERRRLVLPDADPQPLGLRQPGTARHVRRGLG